MRGKGRINFVRMVRNNVPQAVCAYDRFCSVPLEEQSLFSPHHEEQSEGVNGRFVDVHATRMAVYTALRQRDKKKYAIFLQQLQAFRYLWPVARHQEKAKILEATYLAFRILDDIVDGDIETALSVREKKRYLNEKIETLDTEQFSSSDSVEVYFSLVFEAAKKIGIEVRKPMIDMLRSIQFDFGRASRWEESAKQAGDIPICSDAELQKYFFDLDIVGTIGEAIQFFGEKYSEERITLLQPLGEAVRIEYNLKDLAADLRQGLCSVSSEDMQQFGISRNDLMVLITETTLPISSYPPVLRAWMQAQIEKFRFLMEKHKEIMRKSRFNAVIRMVLPPLYVWSGEKGIQHVQSSLSL